MGKRKDDLYGPREGSVGGQQEGGSEDGSSHGRREGSVSGNRNEGGSAQDRRADDVGGRLEGGLTHRRLIKRRCEWATRRSICTWLTGRRCA